MHNVLNLSHIFENLVSFAAKFLKSLSDHFRIKRVKLI